MMWKRILNVLRTEVYKLRGLSASGGSRIFHGVEISHPRQVSLGKNAVIYQHSSILMGNKGRFELGDSSHLSAFVYLLIQDRQLKIGDHVAIGPYTAMFCHSHDIQDPSRPFSQSYLDADITIGSDVFIGSHCIVLPGTVIEDRVVVAANSVAAGRLESGYLYGGSPARQLKAL